MDELLTDFLSDCAEQARTIESGWRDQGSPPCRARTIDEVFRFSRGVRGACGFLDLPRLERVAGAVAAFADQRRKGGEANAEAVELAVAAFNRIKDLLAALEKGRGEPFGDDTDLIERLATSARPAPPAPRERRVDHARVPLATIDVLCALTARLPGGGAGTDASATDRHDSFVGLAAVARDLRALADAARSRPMSRLFLALESFARARGAELGVDIDFKCAGGDIKLDGAIIEAIGDSLEDVVAAAIAGSARGAAKARAELLTIHARAVLDAGVLTVEIDDDGLAEASAVQPVSIFAAYPTLARLAGVAFQPPVAAAVAADDGLARARARLGGMGGDLVRLASPVRGARIRLRLPIPDVGFVAPASFLVVEPMDSPREVVAGALTQAGFAVTAVADTDEASAAPIAGRRFAAVFVDIDLAMGGGDFLKDLRARAGPSLILTGLAAHGGPAMQALARAAGLDGAIGKFDRAGVVALARAARAPAKTEVAA